MPVDGRWSLKERPGFLRLHALPAPDLWHARNTLTERAVGPRSTVTVVLDAAGLKPGDVAGFALFNRPYAWLGVERGSDGLTLTQFDEQSGKAIRVPLKNTRVWLRADCDFVKNAAGFRYSTNGTRYVSIGEPYTMAYGLITFQGVRDALFSYSTRAGAEGGFADFDSIEVLEEPARPIPYGRHIELSVQGGPAKFQVGSAGTFTVVDRGLGRVALRTGDGFVSVDRNRAVSIRRGAPQQAETFQWIETFDGELTLMSLATNRYLRVDPADARILADSPGPRPDGQDGVRFRWRTRQPSTEGEFVGPTARPARRTAGCDVTMHEPFGFVRLHALPAPGVWHARTALTLYAVEPRSTVTVALNVAGLRQGDIAGLALFNRPYAWLGVERVSDGLTLAQFDEQSGKTSRVPLRSRRVWLRAECDFVRNEVGFRYSTDGRGYAEIGHSHTMGDTPIAAHGIRCSLFSCSTKVQAEGGHADFDSFVVTTECAGHQGAWR